MPLPPQIRSCYNNFTEHLLNAYNPNMTSPMAMYRWTDANWRRFIDMIASFGFNTFEFWLTPKLFSKAGLTKPFGQEFARQMQMVINHAAGKKVGVKMLCCLNTVGESWHSHCPNQRDEWDELMFLWDAWTKRLAGLSIVGIFPGDPGGCARNGCNARTFIDASLKIAGVIHRNQPAAAIELGTWGSPFWGWGTMKGPPGWKGEFIQSYQGSGWVNDKARADDAMEYLLRQLHFFPENTMVAINLAFNSDSNPESDGGAQDARAWAREIAKSHRIVTWDFSLTEGENAILPHYRFARLFAQRRKELEAAPYSGGICFTMTPLLNQLSLYQSAQSFIDPKQDPQELSRRFYANLFGPKATALVELLPLFEIVPDWGNYANIDLSRREYHQRMQRGADLLQALARSVNESAVLHPAPELYRRELLFFFDLFARLSSANPDLNALRREYYQRVYAIYDHLPQHVDPRPRSATDRLISLFDPHRKSEPGSRLPANWNN